MGGGTGDGDVERNGTSGRIDRTDRGKFKVRLCWLVNRQSSASHDGTEDV